MTKIIFKNEKGSGGEFHKSWGVYFDGQNDKLDTIVLAWADDTDIYGEGWTQIDTTVCDIIGGGFPKFTDIKNAYRKHANELKAIFEPLGY
jgi:hypothetical protein